MLPPLLRWLRPEAGDVQSCHAMHPTTIWHIGAEHNQHQCHPPPAPLHPRRFRNLEYLEAQADKRRAARQAEAEEAQRWGGGVHAGMWQDGRRSAAGEQC